MTLGLKAKLALGFGLLIALICSLGIAVIIQMGLIDSKTTEITENWMPSIDASHRLNTATSDLRIAEFQHLTLTDEAGMKVWAQKIETVLSNIAALRATYEKLISSQEEKPSTTSSRRSMRAMWKFTTGHSSFLGQSERCRPAAL